MRLLRHPPGLAAVYALAFALVGWTIGLGRLRDNSFFWHLRTGELILDEGIPRADPYSYTAEGTRWIAQSWLAEVAYGLVDRVAGPFALRLLAGGVGAAIAGLAFLLAWRVGGDRARAAGLTLLALGPLAFSFSPRPLILGVLLLLALVWVVEVPRSWVGRHELLAVPVVLWLWVNVHGTWILAFGYLGLHLAGRWLEGAMPWEQRERRLSLGAGFAAAVVFVNPYGWRLVTFPLELVGRGGHLRRMAEWSSPDLASPVGIALAIWIGVLLALGARRGFTTRDLVVLLPFVLLALWASRNVVLLPLVTLPIVARATRRVPADADGGPVPTFRLVVVGLLVLVIAGAGFAASRQADFDLDRYPVAALDAVDDGAEGLLTTDRAAGYVILEDWPERRVFLDDRVDMYPVDVIDAYIKLLDGEPGWGEVLDRYGVRTVVWPRARPLASLLDEASGWTRVYEDDDDGVWRREQRGAGRGD